MYNHIVGYDTNKNKNGVLRYGDESTEVAEEELYVIVLIFQEYRLVVVI